MVLSDMDYPSGRYDCRDNPVPCLISTAVVGFLIMKGKGNIPFAWHVNLARLTIVLALIHATLAMVWFFGW